MGQSEFKILSLWNLKVLNNDDGTKLVFKVSKPVELEAATQLFERGSPPWN